MIRIIHFVFVVFLFGCNLPQPAAPILLSAKSETLNNNIQVENDTLVKVTITQTPPKIIEKIILVANDTVYKEMNWDKKLTKNGSFYLNYPFKPKTTYQIFLIPNDLQKYLVLLKHSDFTIDR